jgi:glycosyltransferase involved in cell wall biosynthesis
VRGGDVTLGADGERPGNEPPIAAVVQWLPSESLLRGRSVDVCTLSAACSGRELEIAGWVLGPTPAVAVEVLLGDEVIGRVAVDKARPDVQACFPDVANSGTSGFHARLGILTFPKQGLRLSAVLADQTRVLFALIRVVAQPTDAVAQAPLVSVIIPCFKQAHFLSESIGSVLCQQHAHLEIVVVDDGSPDNTEEIARRVPGVRYLRQRNMGLSAARNRGVRESRGAYVVFLDADDRLLAGAVSTGLREFQERPGLGMVAGHFRVIGLNGRVIASPTSRAVQQDHYLSLLRDYFIGPPGVMMFRREAIDQLGGFDTANSPAADYEIALRVARALPIHVHEEVVLEYRRHAANMSGDPAEMLTATMAVLRQQRRYASRMPGGREAYRAGVRHWRAAWGEPLIRKTAAELRAERLDEAVGGMAVLLRHYPLAIARVVRAIWNENGDPDVRQPADSA